MIDENSSILAVAVGALCTSLGTVASLVIKNYLNKVNTRDDAQRLSENVRLEGGWAKFVDDLRQWSKYVETELDKCRERERACNEKLEAQAIIQRGLDERQGDLDERLRRMEGQTP